MKSEARLDSAIFQLTPTRTRCDLVINANGKTEKLASGLLNPFLSHLRTAQDQIAKGGYSITLQPDPTIDAFWFTKDTVERFVRFVSTPEVLERVTTIESEILQIEEAITVQGNENLGLSTVEDHQTRSIEYIEGSKPMIGADADKAIVLYKPGSNLNPPDSNGSTIQEENSKAQLLRVLETRKIVLQKEQGMAFARAAAAGFDMDHMAHLITFAECFGASRLKEACLRFMELYKIKHETGQWFEVEAAEAMSTRSGFPPFNASGIILAGDTRKQREFGEAWPTSSGEFSAEINGNDVTTDHSSDKDKRLPSDPQVPPGSHEYFYSQFQHPTYPPWAMHPPPGPPAYQPYPMQGMPYYPNYPGSGPFYQPPYPSSEDPRFNPHQRVGRRHSMNSEDNDLDSDTYEEIEQSLSDFEKEASHGRKSHRRVVRSGNKKGGVVVIKNINYVTSKKHEKSGSESESASESGSEEETGGSHSDDVERKHKKSSRSSKKKENHKKSYDTDEVVPGNDADSGNWNAFQSFLLKAEEKMTSTVDADIFAAEKEPSIKRKQNVSEAEPILVPERDSGNINESRIMECDSVNGKTNRTRQVGSNDELLTSSEGRGLRESHQDAQFLEIEGGGRGGYRRGSTDDFVIYGRQNQSSIKLSSDPLVENEYQHPGNLEKSSYVVTDESFVVPFRSGSQDQLELDHRTAIDIDLEFPSSKVREEDSSNNTKPQINSYYEPDELTMMPERATESEYVGYDPAIDYDMVIPIEVGVKQESREHEDVLINTNEEVKKSDREKKVKGPQDGLEKRRKDAMMRRGMPSKSNSLTEAQKRAEKLRAYKVDLQKAKQANEEEQRKRLEALKIERQKRIAARSSNSNTNQSPSTTKQTRSGLPTKDSPSSFKGSKFSDSEPGSNSPLQKLPSRSSSLTKTTRSNGTTNELTKSASSLTEPKEASARIKRLSLPKMGPTDQIPKKNIANGSQTKISAIVQLDKTKSATLPELKIRTPRAPLDLDSVQNKPDKKESLKKEEASKSIQDEKPPRVSNGDDNLVIEKTVVMLENEMVTSSNKDEATERVGRHTEYAAIRAPPSPVVMVEVEAPSKSKGDDRLDSYEVVNEFAKDESQNFSNSVTENFYQAPFARATSIEEPASTNLEHTGAPAVQESELPPMRTESVKARVVNFSDSILMIQSQESFEKPRSKESKGFRKLLKFGRKSHSSASGEGNVDSDGSVVDDQIEAGSSNDVHILKNLISQDDTCTGDTQPRAHRSFSILSPFRSSKSHEKKQAA